MSKTQVYSSDLPWIDGPPIYGRLSVSTRHIFYTSSNHDVILMIMMKEKHKAALFMIIAAFFYALVAAIVKSIDGIPIFERLFFRTAFGTIFIVVIVIRNHIPWKGVNRIGLVSRGVTGFIAAAFYYMALTSAPIADTVTITNTYPFLVVVLSAVFLGEKIRPYHIIALLLSFSGALLIIRPGFTDLNLFYIYALLGSVFLATTYTILKHVRETDSSEVLILYYSVIATLLCIPFMLMGHFVIPDWYQLLQLIGLGLAGSLYQWFLNFAYKYAPAGEVSIYSYTSIVFSSAMGIILWGEYPVLTTTLGMVSIAVGAFVIFRRDGRSRDESVDI